MPFDKTVEALIQEAMQRGDFDRLPGKGKPLDLSAYFEAPEDVRMAYAMLKDAGMVPQEVELLGQVTALKEQFAQAGDEETQRLLREKLAAKQLELDVLLEQRRRARKHH